MRAAEELIHDWPLIETFNLPPQSVVIVAGCYTGIVMEALDNLYKPARILGFDPQDWALKLANIRLASKPNCELYPYGLGTVDGTFPMGEWETDACSFVNTGPNSRVQGDGFMWEFWEAMTRLHVDKVDLFVMNMEGYEFDLLPHIYKEKEAPDFIHRMVVQFHLGLGNDGNYKSIIDHLNAVYDYAIYSTLPAWGVWESA